METSHASTLPVWAVMKMRLDNGKPALKITCPRCDNSALVTLKWPTTEVNRYATRTCTYCFKTAIIPSRESELR